MALPQLAAPTIRFFCSIDDTPLGRMSLAYADAFVGMGFSVRLIATRMGALAEQTEPGKPWARHRGAFLTPIATSYVNVVCGDASDWKRLYTVGVKNVLVTDRGPPSGEPAPSLRVPVIGKHGEVLEVASLGADELALEVALKYHAILVPSEEISSQWRGVGGQSVVIPQDLGRHALELREALFA